MNALTLAARTDREPIRTRRVRRSTLLLFLGASTTLLFAALRLKRTPAGWFLTGPGWWENLSLFSLLLLVPTGGIIFGIGKLRASDLGLGGRRLAEGAVVTGGLWLLMQAMAAAASLAESGGLELHPSWGEDGPRVLAWTAAMFLGAALYEEIAFRGFVFPQLYLRLPGSARARFWTALLGSQLLFAVAHIPAHVAVRGLSGPALWRLGLIQGLGGVMFLLVYLRTRNLWISVGVHGLINAPTPLFAARVPWEAAVPVLAVAWPWLTRRPAHQGLAGVEQVARTPAGSADPARVPAAGGGAIGGGIPNPREEWPHTESTEGTEVSRAGPSALTVGS